MAQIYVKTYSSLVNYGSHLPVLIKAVQMTTGAVLELGMGVNSTPVLHWLCATAKRKLVSYENQPGQIVQWAHYGDHEKFPWHTVRLVEHWSEAEVEQPWDVVLVDHDADVDRMHEVERVAPYAQYVIVHDADGRDYAHNRIREIKALFKFHWVYEAYRPHTAILSNFADLADFHV